MFYNDSVKQDFLHRYELKAKGVFYFDGQQGAYTLADGTWVVKGYVDGVAGEVKFANYAALQSTLTVNSVAGEPKTNTLYIVALEDGVVKQGHAVTSGEPLDAEVVSTTVNGTTTTETYALSSAYESGKTYTVDKVSGTIGDNFSDYLYYDADGRQYYSVVADLTKVVGTMGNPVDQDYYFVYIQNTVTGQSNRLCAQAYAYDKNAAATNAVITATSVTNTVAAVKGNTVDSVKFAAQATAGTGFTGTPDLTVSNVKFERLFTDANGATSWVEMAANEVFVASVSYRATITIDVPSTMTNAQLASTNVITYTAGGHTTTGVYNTVVTDVFSVQ